MKRMRQGHIRVFCSVLFFSVLPQLLHGNEGERIRTILAKSRRAYELLESYEGSGFVQYTNSGGETYHTIHFRIFYKHPGKFRFDWKETLAFSAEEDERVLWTDGEGTYHYWSRVDQYKEELSPLVALAGAKFISGGSSYTVPLLLLREFEDTGPFRLENKCILPVEEFEGAQCHVLSGTTDGEKWTLWISQEDYLIRKIERRSTREMVEERGPRHREVVIEIHQDIKTNSKLEDETFDFDPGEAAEAVRFFQIKN
jgi:outer membrane lipoprotein-sorting protein